MAMSPLALSLLGMDQPPPRRRRSATAEPEVIVPEEIQQTPELRPLRTRARPSSYYNSFQTVCSVAKDDAPSYDYAVRQRVPQRPANYLREKLPGYTCTVNMASKLLLQLESISPLHEATESEWREVYVVLRGTLLSFYRAKDNGPGKLLRSYTLQHAEVGLAVDTQHTVLVPQTRLAHLIPSSARRKAWQKDPHLFKAVRQHLLRLRVETDQIVLADADEEQIHAWIHAISAGIDISHSIDERSIPRQCTVPRRRRRQRASQIATDNITDPALVAEQERILRDMYPAFAEHAPQARPVFERSVTEVSTDAREAGLSTLRDEEELDLAAIREDGGSPDEPSRRPPITRNTTATTIQSTYSADMMYATAPANFTEDGKWQPSHARTAQQVQRYIRRCMPILNAEAIRASDVLICHGKRVKINWRMELLEEWELQPPSYKAHHFFENDDLDLVRTHSQNSATELARQDNPQTSTSDLGQESDDQITRAETALATLDLAKSAVLAPLDKVERVESTKQHVPSRHPGQDIHGGVVFCF